MPYLTANNKLLIADNKYLIKQNIVVYDYDGNSYTYVTIGTQQQPTMLTAFQLQI